MMAGVQDRRRRVGRSRSRVTNTSMTQITVIEMTKISSWPYGTSPSASASDGPESGPPAQDAPVDRPPLGRLRSDQRHAADRYRRDAQAEQEDSFPIEHARQPA